MTHANSVLNQLSWWAMISAPFRSRGSLCFSSDHCELISARLTREEI